MSLKKNIFANYVGRLFLTILSIVFVPLYIKYLGIELYGLVGIYTMLVSIMMLLDVGMSQTIVREVAKYSAKKLSLYEILDTLKTFQYIYIVIGLLITIVLFVFSDFVVSVWLHIGNLDFELVIHSIQVMALSIFINWISILYRNAIVGLEYQVWLNIVDVSFAVISNVGVLLVLVYIESSIIYFLYYKLFISSIQLVFMMIKLNAILPKGRYVPSYSQNVLIRLWKFTSGVALTSIFGTMMSQADKIILSSYVTIEQFGLYTVASIVGRALGNVISPIVLAIRPKLTVLYEQGKEKELIEFYHKSAQLISVLSMPTALILILFSKEILWIWTYNTHIVDEIWLISSLLVAGTLLNGIMYMPYSLQLSVGWSSLAAKSNIVLFVITVPFLIFGVKEYGMIAAPFVWLSVNFFYVLIVVSLFHKRLLVTEKWYWYKYDILYIFMIALLLGLICRYFIIFDENIGRIFLLFKIMAAYFLMLFGAVMAANKLNVYIINKIRTIPCQK